MQEIIFLLILTLLGSGIFSGGEVALIAVSKIKARDLLDSGARNAKYLFRLKENFNHTLITILIGNNVVNIAASAMATKLALDLFGNAGVGIATGVMTLLVLIFGEILPKTFSSKHAVKVSLTIAPFIYFLSIVLKPLVVVFAALSKYLNSFGAQTDDEKITETELSYMVRMGASQGGIKKDENEMIQNILRFDETFVSQIMTPRTELFALRNDLKVSKAVEMIANSSHSRIPIFKGKLDKIVGVVVARDLLNLPESKKDAYIEDFARDAHFVPENKKTDELLRELQSKSVHLSVVVNEHGGVEGVVTIEDLLEEIVGEIFDESDEVEENIINDGKGGYIVKGKTDIKELNSTLSIDLDISEDATTVAGFVQKGLGRVAEVGDRLSVGDKKMLIIVRKVDGPMLQSVLIKIS